MGLTRRSFLSGLIATPAIVQAGNIWVPPRKLVVPEPRVVLDIGSNRFWVVGNPSPVDCRFRAQYVGDQSGGWVTLDIASAT